MVRVIAGGLELGVVGGECLECVVNGRVVFSFFILKYNSIGIGSGVAMVGEVSVVVM